MISKETNIKIKHILKEIAQAKGHSIHIDIVNNSRFVFKKCLAYQHVDIYELKIFTAPDVFYKFFDYKKGIQTEIKDRIEKSTEYRIETVDWILDIDKLEVNQIDVTLIKTEWEEINQLQKKLIDSLKRSTDSMDYQNIGNTSRTIMDKLAREVFDKEKHIPENQKIEIHNGKFKNQLSTYVSSTLSGKSNKELRKMAEASINLVSNSIDLMNKTPHKLDANKGFAELCVVSSISVINVIKTIAELE